MTLERCQESSYRRRACPDVCGPLIEAEFEAQTDQEPDTDIVVPKDAEQSHGLGRGPEQAQERDGQLSRIDYGSYKSLREGAP